MCIGSESELLNVYSYRFDFFYSYLVFPNKQSMLGFFSGGKEEICPPLLSRWFSEWVRHAFAAWMYINLKKNMVEYLKTIEFICLILTYETPI